jgi:hypothetical protein
MAQIIQTVADPDVLAVRDALAAYEADNPGATAAVRRDNPGVIRVRIIDDRTAGVPRSRRHAHAWDYLAQRVGEDVMGQVYQLLVLPTAELRSSLSNLDFDDPNPVNP